MPGGQGRATVVMPAVCALFAQGMGAGLLDASVRQDNLLVHECVVRELGDGLADDPGRHGFDNRRGVGCIGIYIQSG